MTDEKINRSDVLYREMPISLKARAATDDADPNLMTFSASSETPVVRWGDSEILRHDAPSLRLDRLRTLGSVLINHDENQRAAAILSADIVDKRLEVTVRFGKSEFAQQARQDVMDELLRGVSIGYRVHSWDVNEDTRTYTATDWEPFEVTFTPIPADPTVGPARSAEEWGQLVRSITSAARPAVQTTEHRMSDPTQPIPQGNQAAAPITPAAVPTAVSETQRATLMAEQREIATQARSLGLDASEFVGLTRAEAKDAMLVSMATRQATPEPAKPALATINYDAADKARDAFLGGMAARVGYRDASFAKVQEGNPMVGRSLTGMAKSYARMMGLDSSDWEKRDVAMFMLGKPHEMNDKFSRNANVTSSMFPNFVFLNAITKITAKGYEMGSAMTRYRQIVSTQTVPDFKQFSVGTLGVGNLLQTAERMPFPELDKAEGVYNSTVKMWGGTLALTLQALVNDDTGQFERNLRQAGAILDKTIDKRVFQKLLMGSSAVETASTWTSNTTSGGSLVYTTADLAAAARGKLALVRAALMNKVGLDNNPLGTIPRFLLVGPTREGEARGIIGAPAAGHVLFNQQVQQQTLELVVSSWLEAAALTGNSTTSYYLLADPNDVTGLILTDIEGFSGIQVTPYDAGAVAALNYKLWKPFEADLHSMAYTPAGGSSSSTVIAAAQQGTT